jgi:hypothetical protein
MPLDAPVMMATLFCNNFINSKKMSA